jgi:alternate signal-mediated exported protein
MKKTLSAFIATALVIVMVASATFAWFTAKDSVTNHLETAQITDGSTKIVEVFTPPTEWLPGQEITKKVSVANNGDSDVLVRVSFEEVMKLLDGKPKASDTSIDDASNSAKIPQLFKETSYLKDPWKDASTEFTKIEGLSDPNAIVKVQKVENGGKAIYTFAIFHKIQDGAHKGEYQKMTADFAAKDKVLTISEVKYWAFDGITESKAAWATFADSKTGKAGTPPARTDIGTPITDPGKMISLNYNDKTNIINSTPQDKKWWYNETDGFFYYIGKLPAGSITPNLLESLTLDEKAGAEYSGMKFDLIANLEAIQNTEAALTAKEGWNLAGQTDLINALKAYCA